jgi:putative transposase
VLTEIGPWEIDVPPDAGATFDPQIVKKRQRRLTGVDEIVLSLSVKGLTTGEIAALFAEVFRRQGLQRHDLEDHPERSTGR